MPTSATNRTLRGPQEVKTRVVPIKMSKMGIFASRTAGESVGSGIGSEISKLGRVSRSMLGMSDVSSEIFEVGPERRISYQTPNAVFGCGKQGRCGCDLKQNWHLQRPAGEKKLSNWDRTEEKKGIAGH